MGNTKYNVTKAPMEKRMMKDSAIPKAKQWEVFLAVKEVGGLEPPRPMRVKSTSCTKKQRNILRVSRG